MEKKLDTFIKIIRELKPTLVEQYHVSDIALFGSYVRGEEKPESDLDVLVNFSILPSLFGFIDLQIFLSEKLGINVDLVILDDLKPFLIQKVREEKINIL